MTKHRIRRAVLGAAQWKRVVDELRQQGPGDPLISELLRAEKQVLEWEDERQEAAVRRKDEALRGHRGLCEWSDYGEEPDGEADSWDEHYARRRAVVVANEMAKPPRTRDL
jgi:hypothetical protein